MEFNIRVQFERIGQQIGTDGPALRQITDNIWIFARFVSQQGRVMRRQSMHHGEGCGLVQIIGRRLGRHGIGEYAAPLWFIGRARALRQSVTTQGQSWHQQGRAPGHTMDRLVSCIQCHGYVLTLKNVQFLYLGSSQSRRLSPNRLKANTDNEIANPGNRIIHGASL